MTTKIPDDFRTHKRGWRSALEMAVNTAENDADRNYWKHELAAFDKAYAELEAQPESPWGYSVCYPLDACVWYRDSTEEWVFEVQGSINDTFLTQRYTAPKGLAPEDVPSLSVLSSGEDLDEDDPKPAAERNVS